MSAVQPTLDIDAGPKPCKSPVHWMGGKHYSAKHIIAEMPGHAHYVEVFGGGAHVLCQKSPSELETYNDTNGDVVNFFRVCRESPAELNARLQWTPYARATRDELVAQHRNGGLRSEDSVKWAADWFTLLRQTYSGTLTGGWSSARTNRNGCASVSRWCNLGPRLVALAGRFRLAQIECVDFRALVARHDAPTTLFYCDPPYIGTEDYYSGGFNEQAHRDLATLLCGIEGKALVSYYPHPLLNEAYAGWRRKTWMTGKHSQKKRDGEVRDTATELLLMNFDENGEKLDL